jgi:hypothetical protein
MRLPPLECTDYGPRSERGSFRSECGHQGWECLLPRCARRRPHGVSLIVDSRRASRSYLRLQDRVDIRDLALIRRPPLPFSVASSANMSAVLRRAFLITASSPWSLLLSLSKVCELRRQYQASSVSHAGKAADVVAVGRRELADRIARGARLETGLARGNHKGRGQPPQIPIEGAGEGLIEIGDVKRGWRRSRSSDPFALLSRCRWPDGERLSAVSECKLLV